MSEEHPFPFRLLLLLTNQILEQTKQAAAKGDAAVTPLADLDFIPYIDGEGMVTNLDTAGVKASVYAVYDEVSQSMEHHTP